MKVILIYFKKLIIMKIEILKYKNRNTKLNKSKFFNLTNSHLKTNESLTKYIPRTKYFSKIPKYINSINKFKRNKPNNEYLTIKSHLSS